MHRTPSVMTMTKTVRVLFPQDQLDALSVCDALTEYIGAGDQSGGPAVSWFRTQIEAGRASFCGACGQPYLGSLCMTCLELPVCRQELVGKLDPDMLRSHMKDNPQEEQRQLAYSRVWLIKAWRDLADQADCSADYVIYREAAIAAKSSVSRAAETDRVLQKEAA
ncbi:hypothetical protein CCAX7_000580 [Capsulimonas corticalis]|uniref:Uncharacterized protein n=1 Tax=Capsulimonas corticalis TaxID=2219043 RepID=A0A402CRI2_9BACT|nr:hypothetical protein [Capsulimonas corticalis]BDI28007.1 hypothetical protein CCAX7_000580 [Capsulimonas corticalis]